jgi:hypothetical protein
MGYRRERKIYNLIFEDEDMRGLEVKTSSVPIGEILKLSHLGADLKNSSDVDSSNVETLFSVFADALISWNLEDENGTPVPATIEGLYSQDADFVLAIITTWANVVGGVSRPLNRNSSNGKQYPEELIPMETLSPSPLN